MSFKRVVQKEEDVVKTLRRQLAAAANHDVDGKGAMSHGRFLGTFFSLFLGLILIYSSVFYLPAVLDVHKVMGISTEKGKAPALKPERGKLSGYTDFLKIRRGYFRKGQVLTLAYDLAPGSTMTASISRCSAPPVIEVFYCRDIEGQVFKIASDIPDKRDFIIRKSGFYYFDDLVTQKGNSSAPQSYYVHWSRRSLNT